MCITVKGASEEPCMVTVPSSVGIDKTGGASPCSDSEALEKTGTVNSAVCIKKYKKRNLLFTDTTAHILSYYIMGTSIPYFS